MLEINLLLVLKLLVSIDYNNYIKYSRYIHNNILLALSQYKGVSIHIYNIDTCSHADSPHDGITSGVASQVPIVMKHFLLTAMVHKEEGYESKHVNKQGNPSLPNMSSLTTSSSPTREQPLMALSTMLSGSRWLPCHYSNI